ncbi:MAG: tRNA (adenosine(37)-N6)-threonylcarbamoyltransferase complex dimerization subunit type 1 TsaB [Rhodocyclaceae bacterium]|nr:tRNA (adenosine(37)-N6)-threonylcarbamoyltransferase complex dimerization subunit type 1 TsaB [Rhodocyclaceae bacterium]
MNLLALETSTRRLSVALATGSDLVEMAEDLPNGGSERVLPWVMDLLAGAGLAPADLDGIAFGAGPGGFTGLRLACGIAQGLGWGLEIPVLPVGTLDALSLAAFEAGAGERIFACLDARMNEVYAAAFELRGGLPVALVPPGVSAAAAVALPPGGAWAGCGDGFAAWGDALAVRLAGHVAKVRADLSPTAAAVARLALPRLAAGEGVSAGSAAPLYVRDKVALTTAERLARGGLR